jgi:hypothetical protein
LPDWLADLEPTDRVDPMKFLRSSRIVFYPGSDVDGHAVKIFGSAHAAHCFVMVDYQLSLEDIERNLAHEKNRFRGYRAILQQPLDLTKLLPSGWTRYADRPEMHAQSIAQAEAPFALVVILEREPKFDDVHGPARLGLLFICGDGIETFDALFAQRGSPPIFAVLIHDHAFGGNYTEFGGDGLLWQVAKRAGAVPNFLVLGDGTVPWPGFGGIQDVAGSRGGMYRRERFLYEQQCDGKLDGEHGRGID